MAKTNGKPKRITFNKLAIEALQADDKRYYVSDAKTPNLAICVTPNSTKTFYWRGRIDGRPERIKLGRFPGMTVDAARKATKRIHGTVACGKNPADERRDVRDLRTLQDLFVFYLEAHAKLHKKSTKEDEYRYRLHLSRWKSYPLAKITRAKVAEMHATIAEEHGKVTANRAIQRLRAFFNFAIDTEKWRRVNPAARFKRFDEVSRDRFLDADELRRWFAAVEQEPSEAMKSFFKLALFTGARRANVQSARWSDISFSRQTWTIPAYHAKQNRSILIPLTKDALDVLRLRREAVDDDCDWVFPSNRNKTGHLTEPKAAWKRILKRANIRDCTIHDLRRTFASWQAMNGASLEFIGKSLGHQDSQATRIYARLKDSRVVRDSAEAATTAMLAAANGEGGGHDDE